MRWTRWMCSWNHLDPEHKTDLGCYMLSHDHAEWRCTCVHHQDEVKHLTTKSVLKLKQKYNCAREYGLFSFSWISGGSTFTDNTWSLDTTNFRTNRITLQITTLTLIRLTHYALRSFPGVGEWLGVKDPSRAMTLNSSRVSETLWDFSHGNENHKETTKTSGRARMNIYCRLLERVYRLKGLTCRWHKPE